MAAFLDANLLAKNVIDVLELIGAFEIMKIASDRSFWRKFMGQHVLLATGF
jgi:hypothetical protein